MGDVVSREALIARIRDARASGRTVAFANGCFDLLHVGHVRYLEAAAQEADVLVVAINDDESVRALKGDGRPVLAAEHRAELVAALRCVDFVFAITTSLKDSSPQEIDPRAEVLEDELYHLAQLPQVCLFL